MVIILNFLCSTINIIFHPWCPRTPIISIWLNMIQSKFAGLYTDLTEVLPLPEKAFKNLVSVNNHANETAFSPSKVPI
jgi:hypothetical protein